MKHRWFILFCCCTIMHVAGNKSMHNVSNITHAASRYAAIDTHTHTHTQACAFSPCLASVMFGVCEGSAGWASSGMTWVTRCRAGLISMGSDPTTPLDTKLMG